jgi:hypothetical protein
VKNKGWKKNNNKPQDVPCYLCRLRGMQLKTIYGCPQCQVGFHVECFTAYHYQNALRGNVRALMDMITTSELLKGKRDRKSSYISSVQSIVLPVDGAPCSNIQQALRAKQNAKQNGTPDSSEATSEESDVEETQSRTSSGSKDKDSTAMEEETLDGIERIPV